MVSNYKDYLFLIAPSVFSNVYMLYMFCVNHSCLWYLTTKIIFSWLLLRFSLTFICFICLYKSFLPMVSNYKDYVLYVLYKSFFPMVSNYKDYLFSVFSNVYMFNMFCINHSFLWYLTIKMIFSWLLLRFSLTFICFICFV